MKKTAVRILSVIMLLVLLSALTACSVKLRPFGRPQEEVCEHEYLDRDLSHLHRGRGDRFHLHQMRGHRP